MTRVAVVTGANKGIGYAIVRGLCRQFEGIVYLTARNVGLGEEALKNMNSEVSQKTCKELRFHQLDITEESSVKNFRAYLQKEHGGLDILINNAGFAHKRDATEPFGVQAEVTYTINYLGTKRACEELIPLLRPHGRVVNVSSQAGLFKYITDDGIKQKLLSPSLTVEELEKLLTDFVKYAKEGTHKDHGYPDWAYGMSKVGVTAYTFILQRRLATDSRPDLIINACCPGYVKTDMTSNNGKLTTDEGAETPLYLALLPENATAPKGKFVYLKAVRDPITGEPV